jgi:cytochrome c oxidase accessory protein FixG
MNVNKITITNVTNNGEQQVSELYSKRQHIYVRQVSGFFQRLSAVIGFLLLALYFALPWLSWQGRQAVLFDIPERRFYIFGITFWPEDFILVTTLLIIAAFGLFFVTVLAGRVWCGYTCPQTVWTKLFIWLEGITEGSRQQRIRLDKSRLSINKVLRKTLKHSLWLLVAVITALTFVGYFTPINQLSLSLLSLDISPWQGFWLAFFTLATYANAGWLREQVCTYMCPYARFQAVMFDSNTFTVAYDANRGEPRGSRKKNSDTSDTPGQSLGDCIDCQQCVQVCPTGIDIRQGLQYQCIGCALCIDACNNIMDKMGYARGLIRYTTENALANKASKILRPRLLGYGLALTLALIGFVSLLAFRAPVALEVARDRQVLYRQNQQGLIENVYTLKVINKDQQGHRYQLSVTPDPSSGVKQLTFAGPKSIYLQPGEIRSFPIQLVVDPGYLKGKNFTVFFTLTSDDPASKKQVKISKESRFIGPLTY